MAAPNGRAPAPQKEKVKDVIQYFRAAKRFKPDDSHTRVTSIDFDDTGELAIVCRTDDTLQIYNCKEGKHAKELKSQKYGADLARFTHHKQSILHASTKIDHQIRYLSTHDNSYIRYFKGHEGRVTCLTMCPSNDDFLSCAEDDTVRLWNISSSNSKGWLNIKAPYLAAYDPSASVIAIASGLTYSVMLYDLRNYDKQPFSTFDLYELEMRYSPNAQGKLWTKLEFSNDGKSILVGTAGHGHYVLDSFEGTVKHFCRRTGASQRLPPGGWASLFNSDAPVVSGGNSRRATGQGDVCFTPDGQFLVGGSGGDDGVLVWDLRQPETADNVLRHAYRLPLPNNVVDRAEIVAYNPRFNMMCTADKNVLMWQPDLELFPPS